MQMTPITMEAMALAKQCEIDTKLPWQLTFSQWALESGWGQHSPGNNPFGIKEYAGEYGSQVLNTTEEINGVKRPFKLAFASFPNLGAAFAKHADLITNEPVYSSAWHAWLKDPKHTPESLAAAIAPIYSSASDYKTELLEIMAELKG